MCSRKFTKGKLRSWINELKKDRGKEYERVTRRRRLKMKDRSLNKMQWRSKDRQEKIGKRRRQ